MADGDGKSSIGPSSGTRESAARKRGQTFFTASEAREGSFRAEVERERKATDTKTAKLRALRLAKEEDERIAAANAPPVPKKTRVKKEKPAAS